MDCALKDTALGQRSRVLVADFHWILEKLGMGKDQIELLPGRSEMTVRDEIVGDHLLTESRNPQPHDSLNLNSASKHLGENGIDQRSLTMSVADGIGVAIEIRT